MHTISSNENIAQPASNHARERRLCRRLTRLTGSWVALRRARNGSEAQKQNGRWWLLLNNTIVCGADDLGMIEDYVTKNYGK